MISKEEVYKYLSEGLLSEKLFNFKEDDDAPETDDTQNNQDNQNQKGDSDTERPDLSWHFIKDKMILYNGSADRPTEQYGIFSDVIRYYQFNKKDDNKDNKDNNKKDDKFAKDFKTKAKNFATAAMLGGVTAVAADAASKALNTADKNKKDKNGNEDKWKDFAQADFSTISAFQKHAQNHHVPSSLIDNFINSYNQLKQSSNKDNKNNNSQK